MPDHQARVDVSAVRGKVQMLLSTSGVNPVPILLEPQFASELAENLAKSAYEAHTGRPARTDISHLHAQVVAKVNPQMEKFLRQRLELMLNSLREDKNKSNAWLARELLETVLSKVA